MPASIQISRRLARRFMLAHHYLWPPRKLRGKQGVLEYIDRVGCIQFDSINVVARNADLVLQSRVKNYREPMLESLLYKDRSLIDGWDKVASIFRSEDWPHFERRRQHMRRYYHEEIGQEAPTEVAEMVKELIAKRGPLSSIDIDHDENLERWSWGNDTRAVRAAMQMLFSYGELVVHSRVNTRRLFDLSEKLLSDGAYGKPDPHESEQDYQDWHVLRRIGGLGLAHPGAGEHWGGMHEMKSPERRRAIGRLLERGEIVQVLVEGLEKEDLFMRSSDLPLLEEVQAKRAPRGQAAFLAPLDNFMWGRRTVRLLYDFDYVWEVYKPADKRLYGYYVLPVLYSDRLVGRVDPGFDRDSQTLIIKNWWWEEGVNPENGALAAALKRALRDFGKFLGAKEIRLSEEASSPALAAAIDF